jgi:hypothetical protein
MAPATVAAITPTVIITRPCVALGCGERGPLGRPAHEKADLCIRALLVDEGTRGGDVRLCGTAACIRVEDSYSGCAANGHDRDDRRYRDHDHPERLSNRLI